LYRIKKKQRLIYRHYPGWTPYELKVICKVNWGDEVLVKCKVLSKDWYNQVYLTKTDFQIQAGTHGFSRVTYK